jgi:hypothetical protein
MSISEAVTLLIGGPDETLFFEISALFLKTLQSFVQKKILPLIVFLPRLGNVPYSNGHRHILNVDQRTISQLIHNCVSINQNDQDK